jgi:hypothetical protein
MLMPTAATEGPTPASVWQAVAGEAIGEGLLPPDLFALTNVILHRSEAYRFALSLPGGLSWPPSRASDWGDAVAEAGLLEPDELSVLTSWAEAVAEALVDAPERVPAVLADADGGAPWRGSLGPAEPSAQLDQAIKRMSRAVRTATPAGADRPMHALLHALRDRNSCEPGLERLTRRVLRSALEQRQARQAREGEHSAT